MKNPDTILDIGAGTGLIALMLAQRSGAETIDALEINEDAYEQCVDNFEASPWTDRLFCYHAGLDEFMDEIEDPYELIVSNPPFIQRKLRVVIVLGTLPDRINHYPLMNLLKEFQNCFPLPESFPRLFRSRKRSNL